MSDKEKLSWKEKGKLKDSLEKWCLNVAGQDVFVRMVGYDADRRSVHNAIL